MAFDPASDYPLGQKRPELVTTPSGLPLDEVTLESLRAGALGWEDLRATPETLRRQAAVAEAAGRTALAGNLSRAAELATVPAETILDLYTALRPLRSTAGELEAWAARLEELGAPLTAAFVREATEVYAGRGLLRDPRVPGASLASAGRGAARSRPNTQAAGRSEGGSSSSAEQASERRAGQYT